MATVREEIDGSFTYCLAGIKRDIRLEDMINYVTPGYTTSVFVAAQGVQRIRTTAESHQRIAIVEVMGRQSGYIALGTAYGQPDLILVPEYPLNRERLLDRVREIYDIQKDVVIVVSEGIVGENGKVLGDISQTKDPSGNTIYSGAAEAIKQIRVNELGDRYFTEKHRHDSANTEIFTRKIGHTQRGGRPIMFDRLHASHLGGKAIDMLHEGWQNGISILQRVEDESFYLDSIDANLLRDQWGEIHPRYMHISLYDPERFQPSEKGVDYLKPIFTNAIGADDVEWIRAQLFDPHHLSQPYHSVNFDMQKRILYLG